MAICEIVHGVQEKKYTGVFVPVITPFIGGQIDREGLDMVVARIIQEGANGLFFLGHTGEFEHLSMDQKKQIIDMAVSYKPSGVKIVVGTTGNNASETNELTKYAELKGADAAVIAPKYNNTLETLDYMRQATKDTAIDLVLYNNPGICSHRNILQDDARQLLQIYRERLAVIKDSSEDSALFDDFMQLRGEFGWFSVFQGSEKALLDRPYQKPDGIVPGTGNVEPKRLTRIYYKMSQGKFSKTDADFFELSNYVNSYRGKNPIREIKMRLANPPLSLIRTWQLAPNNR